MADFFQTGQMATLHRLGPQDVERLEGQLRLHARENPIALILPCHAQELGSEALDGILRELAGADFLSQIVVGLDGASSPEYERARNLFGALPQRTELLWNDGPEISRLLDRLREAGFDPGPSGKGRNLWLCAGCVIAGERARVVAVHDCDILTYRRELLVRLCYPVAHTNLGYDFCKGYSARFTDRLNGRAMRLLFTPLIRALRSVIGEHEFLGYMDAFRYPLAGEVCLDLDLLRRTRIPADWGVEVGLLAEVFRLTSSKGICQVEIAESYEHKHQDLSARDPSRGLHKMAIDIAHRIFRTVAGQGIRLDTGAFDTLLTAYRGKAEDTLRFYSADAEINGLSYDRHSEELAVTTFAHSIRLAARAYLEDPLEDPLIPDWNRVQSALPDILEDFKSAAVVCGSR